MSTTAQILANRRNSELSRGPVTIEGRARVSQNATRFGLFSVANFVRPEEQQISNEFESAYMIELAPDSSLEQTLAREIIHAAWRLRRCASLEVAPPENLTDEELDRLQGSIDRARAAAQRTFHRSLKELRRLQSGHVQPAVLMLEQAKAMDAMLLKNLEERQQQATEQPAARNSANQSQSKAEETALIPRGAPCPCKSGQNHDQRRSGQALSPELLCSR